MRITGNALRLAGWGLTVIYGVPLAYIAYLIGYDFVQIDGHDWISVVIGVMAVFGLPLIILGALVGIFDTFVAINDPLGIFPIDSLLWLTIACAIALIAAATGDALAEE